MDRLIKAIAVETTKIFPIELSKALGEMAECGYRLHTKWHGDVNQRNCQYGKLGSYFRTSSSA